MREKVDAQMMDQALNRKDSISVLSLLAIFKVAYHSSKIFEGATVWLFWELMIHPSFSATKVRLEFSSSSVNEQEGTISSYGKVENDLLTKCPADVIIVKADEEIWNFKHGALMQWVFSQKLGDLTVRSGESYSA